MSTLNQDEPVEPADWPLTRIRAVCEKASTRNPTKLPDNTFDYIDVSSINRDTCSIVQATTMIGQDAPSRARKAVRRGDVLFATVRPTLRRVALVPDYLDEQIASTAFAVLRAQPGRVDNNYLYYSVLTDTILQRMEALQRGASYPAVTDNDVLDCEIPLPPLPEQRAIAAVLSKIQQAIEVQEKLVATLKELKAATMEKLFREGVVRGLMFDTNAFDAILDGRLPVEVIPQHLPILATVVQAAEVKQCRDTARRDQLLQILLQTVDEHALLHSGECGDPMAQCGTVMCGDGATKEALKNGSPKRHNDALIGEVVVHRGLTLVSDDADFRKRVHALGGEAITTDDLREGRLRPLKETEIGEVPASWEVLPAGKLIAKMNYGTSRRCTLEPKGAPVLRIPNVIGEAINTDELKYCLPAKGEMDRFGLTDGDLLFVRTNGNRSNVGRCAVFHGTPEGSMFASYLIRVRFGASLLADFAHEFFCTSAGHEQLTTNASPASDGKFNINTQTIKAVLVPVPPTTQEQSEIVDVLNLLTARRELAERKLGTYRDLFASALHQLMTGQLRVTEIMDDEGNLTVEGVGA